MFLAKVLNADLNIGWRNLKLPETPTGSISKFSLKDGKYSYLETFTYHSSIDG
jgi:hypothetical protein